MSKLICKGVLFHSPGDEKAFFDWIEQIRCIADVTGVGDRLYLHIPRKRISEANLRELLALFRRYRVAMKQLAQFEHASNRGWFRDPRAYWYRAVFET